MPPETNDSRIAEIRKLLAHRHVAFERRAHHGHPMGAEPDDLGLDDVMPRRLTLDEKEDRLLAAMIEFIDQCGRPNRLDESYGTVYEFRLEYRSLHLYIKTKWPQANAAAPVLVISSVKKQN